ncbi:MAG: nucleotide exchange factor GrpE [Candidatus Krumholzibacteria bacterium]
MVDEKDPFGSHSVIDLQAARRKSHGRKSKRSDKNEAKPPDEGLDSGQRKTRRGTPETDASRSQRRAEGSLPVDALEDPAGDAGAESQRDASSVEEAAREGRSAGALDELEQQDAPDGFDSPGALDELEHAEAEEPEVVVEFEEPSARPKKKSKRKKNDDGYTGSERRKPSDQEVLARLLEKNEVILQLSKKNVQLGAAAKGAEDRHIRVTAEFENYRKRTRKEWELLKQQTRAEVILDMLEIVDDFERAFAVLGNRNDDFVQGIRLIYNNMMAILVKFGVAKMEALRARFDPIYHMAVANIDSKDVVSNHVVEIIQEGYLLGDTVIRPAKVVIAK